MVQARLRRACDSCCGLLRGRSGSSPHHRTHPRSGERAVDMRGVDEIVWVYGGVMTDSVYLSVYL